MKVCIIHFILLALFSSQTKAQDSLYLVGTITGESTEKQITDISGVGDVNGDGYDDFMVSSRTGLIRKDQGIVKLYLGAADGNLIPDVIFHYPGTDSLNDFGRGSGIGDVNGDDYNDFLITGSFGDWGFPKGKAFLYLGGASIDTLPVKEFYEPWIQDNFGYPAEAVGDINKDGYDDFIISSPYNWTDGKGYVYLFWGGDTISFIRCDTLKGYESGDQFGLSAANIGDINNDGFDDIAVGALYSSIPDSPLVRIYFGGNRIDTIPKYFLSGGDIYNAGDINGDKNLDFIVFNGMINLYLSLDSNITFKGSYYVGTNGDINNDSYDDFILGEPNYTDSSGTMIGCILGFYGDALFDTLFDFKMTGENKWDEYGKYVSIIGDINGDGYTEVAVGALNYPDYQYPLGKVYVYSYKKLTNVKDGIKNTPNNFQLYQNYPNPFNPRTSITYNLPRASAVTITIFDILGNKIRSISNSSQSAGIQSIVWNGTNNNNSQVASGLYLYHFKAVSLEGKNEIFESTGKLLLLK
ncbi:MAG: T9SS type A sorting domain-containing protein [Ignavibacteriae bacterium]|nr:T9SS type A sorting domain-containing protein [Ignavibacteriota bacterium]